MKSAKASALPDRVAGEVLRHLLMMLALSGLISLLGITLSLYIMQVFDRVLSSGSLDTLLFLSLAAGLALVTAALLDGLRSVALGRIADWTVRRLAPSILFRSIERRLTEGNLRSEMLRDLSSLRLFLAGPGVPAFLELPWMPLYLLVAFLIHPVMGIIAVIGAILLFAVAFLNEVLSGTLIRKAALVSAGALRESDAILRNAEVVDSLGMSPQMIRRWGRKVGSELAMQERIQRNTAAVMSGTRLCRALIQVVLYASAAMLVLDHQITGGAMMAGSIIVSRLLAPVEGVLTHWRGLLLSRETYRRLRAFLLLPPVRTSATALPAPNGRLEVQGVTVFAPRSGTPILRNVGFALEPGEHLAIVGPAGSGKTTLSRVILGVFPAQAGLVRLDGADIAKWRREELGRHLGYLPQDVELFEGTVAENIGRFGAADDQEVVRAARAAGCHNLILALPDGYDTEIGEGGLLLSGGQRQQIGLARALFGSPRFIVLDEPNSNLDARGEQALRFALARLKAAGVTVIIVTHRQSVISQMDKLLVLQNGAVRAFGDPDTVIAAMREVAAEPSALPEGRKLGRVAPEDDASPPAERAIA
jgi:PrtD family type I secretion system ABC transporter